MCKEAVLIQFVVLCQNSPAERRGKTVINLTIAEIETHDLLNARDSTGTFRQKPLTQNLEK
jgi:hypothetical protein